jgi:AraC family transcriptional regulator
MERAFRFDMGAYTGFDTERYVTPTLSSWDDAGWRSLLVQRFQHIPEVEHMTLPPSTDRHLWLITEGRGWIQAGGLDGSARVGIRPGQLGMAVPGEPTHVRYVATAPMETIHVHLPQQVVDRVTAQLGVPARVDPPGEDAVLESMLRTLAAAAQRDVDALYAEAAAEFMAVHLVAGSGTSLTSRAATGEDARVRKAVAVMRERLAEPLSLADIAAEVHLSTYHFLRVFKNVTGQTPRRYLTRLRIEQAKRLLDSGLSVTETATRCGFSSPAHLSTAFLHHTGLRPSAYRLR